MCNEKCLIIFVHPFQNTYGLLSAVQLTVITTSLFAILFMCKQYDMFYQSVMEIKLLAISIMTIHLKGNIYYINIFGTPIDYVWQNIVNY
jgi:hypothetical protein